LALAVGVVFKQPDNKPSKLSKSSRHGLSVVKPPKSRLFLFTTLACSCKAHGYRLPRHVLGLSPGRTLMSFDPQREQIIRLSRYSHRAPDSFGKRRVQSIMPREIMKCPQRLHHTHTGAPNRQQSDTHSILFVPMARTYKERRERHISKEDKPPIIFRLRRNDKWLINSLVRRRRYPTQPADKPERKESMTLSIRLRIWKVKFSFTIEI
jgi:hypothetical protein